MRLKITSLLCLVSILNLFSQDQEIWYNSINIPPSPNAAALAKYIEVPVNKSTGIPSISIPIIDISQPNIPLPITITYHGGGIKVEESSSWIGIGWVINSGGVITRSMRGLPDEKGNRSIDGFLFNSDRVPSELRIETALNVPSLRETVYEQLEQIAEGYRDYESDMFYYNFGNNSGSFVFGIDRIPVILPFEDILIEPYYSNDEIAWFRVIDGNGIVYWFGGDGEGYDCTERTNVDVKGPDQPPYISSWYLCKIYNPNTRSTVRFYYDSYTYSQSISHSQSMLYTAVAGGCQPGSISNNLTVTTLEDARILDSIVFDNGKIAFYNSESIEGGYKIDSMQWTNFSRERTFEFEYGTFGNNRLKLISFKETTDQPEIVYSFDYNSTPLPSKTSYAQDHWGFYNGKTNNTNLLPTIVWGVCTLGFSDRSVDTLYTKAGSLVKLHYPTGGYTEFNYENNAYGRSIIPDDISTPDGRGLSVTGVGFRTIISDETQVSFSVDTVYYGFVLNAHIEYSDPGSIDSLHNIGTVRVFDETLQTEVFYSQVRALLPVQNEELNLDTSHVYTLEISAAGEVTTTIASLEYKKYLNSSLIGYTESLAGGIRIKKITNFKSDAEKINERCYDYLYSGYLTGGLPDYVKSLIHYEWSGGISTAEQQLFLYSGSVSSLGASGNSVAYEQVDEYLGSPSDNRGRITTKFISQTDAGSNTAPFRPSISFQWLRSKVLQEIEYKFDSFTSTYSQISLKKNYYFQQTPSSLFSVLGFKASRVQTFGGYMAIPDYLNDFEFSNFYIYGYWHRIEKEERHKYFDNNDICTTTQYYYDSQLHTNPTRIMTIDSKGDTLLTLNKFPKDYVTLTNDCSNTYYNETEDCKAEAIASNLETITCLSIYGSCFTECLDCYDDLTQEYQGFLEAYPPYWICTNDFSNCLIDSGYFNCLASASDYYTPCMLTAKEDYAICRMNFNSVYNDSLETISDILQEPISYMVKRHMVNTPLEKIIYHNNRIVDQMKWKYHITDDTLIILQSV